MHKDRALKLSRVGRGRYPGAAKDAARHREPCGDRAGTSVRRRSGLGAAAHVGLLCLLAAVLFSPAPLWGYGGQAEDERVVQEAIREGIVDAHPFPLNASWADWVNNCGNFLSYRSNCIRRWQEVAEATDMTAEQRKKAKALHEKYEKIHHLFDETTTPVRHKLGDRRDEAKEAGDDELADKLNRLRHVQTHQKLAIEGAASEDLLRLLTPKQQRAWHGYRVAKHAVKKMRERILYRKVQGENLEDVVGLTAEQKARVETMAWKLAKEEFLPTVEHPENVSAFAIYGQDEKRAKAMADEKLYPEVVRTVLTDSQREKLGVEQGLRLVPCMIHLVDGREVEGRLATQVDMPEHLIVYSPRLATVRSFLKRHVHAVTVDGTRRELNPKRALTDEDRELLGRVAWPDEPPSEGRKPAYTAQTWSPPERLLIWKKPGTSGILHDPDNWVVVGGTEGELWPPVDHINPRDLKVSWLGTGTDILVPAAERSYQSRFRLRPAGIIKCRHVTVERNAKFAPSTVPAMMGNLWVARGGAYRTRYTTALTGDRQTFVFNDQPRLTPDSPEAKPVRRGYIVPAKGSYGMAQYVNVRKEPPASVEFVGTVVSSDDFQLLRGTAVVAENSQLWPGTRSVQRIPRGTTLRLMSGAEYGKAHNAAGSGYGFKYSQGSMDIIVAGRIEVGTRAHPITEDVRFGISFKAPAGFRDVEHRVPGMILAPGAQVAVHTADPEGAKLVFCWHRRHNAWFEGRLDGYKQMPEEITIAICDDVMLENVRFDDLAVGGLLLENPSIAKRWRNVTFGDRCRGRPQDLIAKWPDALREPVVSDDWYRNAASEE